MPKGSNRKKTNGKIGRKIKISIQFVILFTLLAILGVILYFYINYGKTILKMQSQAKEMVDKSTEDTFRSSQTSVIYDTDGNLIKELKAEKDVYYIKYNDIPVAAIDAMVVTEDRNFFEHDGVDYWANVRAAITLIKHKGEITQGASTITQQLARGIFLTQEVTYTRKIKEIFVAQELEKLYTKNQIIEFYLNSIYFANGHYGIQAASQAYFGKGVSSLSLSQIAFLCAIPNNPNLYNPLTKIENTLKRRDRILKQMYDNGKIDETAYNKALNETIKLSKDKEGNRDYIQTYVSFCAIRALMEQKGFEFKYQFESEEEKKAYDKSYSELYDSFQKDLYVNGYRIYTSIDLNKQKLLQQAVDETLSGFTEKNEDGVYKMQAASVCIDNDTGRVVAIVGGRGQDLGDFTLNRAYQSFRQPGSTIKPLIVYTPAFERNYTPASIVWDKYSPDGPKNSDSHYLGKINLQTAVWKSKNVIAWKLFKEITPKVGLSYLLRMNFSKITEKDYTLASALGGLTQGVSPVEMASAYATLENKGYYREPTCIVKIMNADGKEIVGDKTDARDVYDSNATKIMTEVLTGVLKYGTGKGLGLKYTISAGKTGTTNSTKDGWFIGYTPYYTTSVWVGYDIPKMVDNLTGSSYPGKIWHTYMDQIHTPSMNGKFEYYDWRSVLKQKEDMEKLTQKPTPSPLPEATIAPTATKAPEDTGEDVENPDDTGTVDDTGNEDTGEDTGTEDTSGQDTTGDTSGGEGTVDDGTTGGNTNNQPTVKAQTPGGVTGTDNTGGTTQQ
jgi:penicillin-binding protein, 1A family